VGTDLSGGRAYSIRTEKAYEHWACRFIAFCRNRDPRDLYGSRRLARAAPLRASAHRAQARDRPPDDLGGRSAGTEPRHAAARPGQSRVTRDWWRDSARGTETSPSNTPSRTGPRCNHDLAEQGFKGIQGRVRIGSPRITYQRSYGDLTP
jgi:hypothetical protein